MNTARAAALAMLRSPSPDFFGQLRGALARTGLTGEEKFGVGVFFAVLTRFRPRPLRLAIHESTEGGAKYLLRAVSKLLEPGTVHDVFAESGWSRFAADPAHTVAYVPRWSERSRAGARLEIEGNRLSHIYLRERAGRIVETPHTVEAPFVCVASQYPEVHFGDPGGLQRWLTMKLPAPPSHSANATTPLDDDEISVWLDGQRLMQERAKVPILLPEWGDLVIEMACQDERSARHQPAFLEAWKTMSLLSLFRGDDGCERETLQASFEDLAATSLLLRGVFREGHWFPSPAKVFGAVFAVGEERALINPLSGKAVRYTRRDDQPVQWRSLLSDV
jgi:hypothetical protein